MGMPSLTLQPLPQCRNKVLIDKYGDDVIAAYAQGFVKDIVMGASLRTAANHLMLAAAQAAHLAEFERVTAENARVAALHASEVKEKQFKEQQYTKVGSSTTMGFLSTGQGESVPVYTPLLDFTSSGTSLPYHVAPLVPSLNLPMISPRPWSGGSARGSSWWRSSRQTRRAPRRSTWRPSRGWRRSGRPAGRR